ncbi:hypothetical protein BSLA_02f0850 [Burkholderia stabilis]|nr:hypothetical protein BSLA_02f0850 [Burkholderia stabilis]
MWSVSQGSSPERRDGISVLTACDACCRRRVIPKKRPDADSGANAFDADTGIYAYA